MTAVPLVSLAHSSPTLTTAVLLASLPSLVHRRPTTLTTAALLASLAHRGPTTMTAAVPQASLPLSLRRKSPSKLNLPEGALVSAAANAGAKTSMSVSFAEETTPGDQREVGWEPKHRVEDGHGVQTTMSVESTMKGETGDQPVAWLSQYKSASEVIGASNEWKRFAFKERTPRAGWLMRKLTTTSYSPVTTKKKKQKKRKLPVWICDLCQRTVSLQHLTIMAQHLATKRHLSKLKAMNTLVEVTPTPGSPRNGDESVAENGGGGGNAPRPLEEPLSMWASLVLPEFRSSYNIHMYDGPENSVYYCKACYAYYTGDSTLALHLVGKRHRRKSLQGRQ